jgi:hypothetical protein
VNISVTGDRLGGVYSGGDSSPVSSPGSALSSTTGGNSGEDRLSVTESTLKIHDALSAISASQSSRISRLQYLYASGRYDASPAKTAEAIISGAMANTNKI